ncbi:L-threonylcarbamoyladenylate synthase, partial [Arenimonas caeni]
AFGGGLAAPSANRFGHVSPTRAAHVRAEFGEAVPVVLDGGDCAVGIESTIVDLSGAAPRILRPGMLGRERIEAVIGSVAEGGGADSPRASGTLDAHYAPRTPLLLLPRAALADEAAQQQVMGKAVQVLALGQLPDGTAGLALPATPAAYAHGLYAALRELDGRGANLLLAERPPGDDDWAAIHDRLRRSAAGAGLDAEPT